MFIINLCSLKLELEAHDVFHEIAGGVHLNTCTNFHTASLILLSQEQQWDVWLPQTAPAKMGTESAMIKSKTIKLYQLGYNMRKNE